MVVKSLLLVEPTNFFIKLYWLSETSKLGLSIDLSARKIFIPFFKIIKDTLTIIGFWKGYITKKQEF